MRDSLKPSIVLAVAAVAITYIVAQCSIIADREVTKMVEAGATPTEAACAIKPGSVDSTRCAIAAEHRMGVGRRETEAHTR